MAQNSMGLRLLKRTGMKTGKKDGARVGGESMMKAPKMMGTKDMNSMMGNMGTQPMGSSKRHASMIGGMKNPKGM